MPSFLDLLGGKSAPALPRWWLEPSYEPLLCDAEGLAFELRGGNVKCQTEEDYATASGSVRRSGKANRIAEHWADLMTEKYQELALREPIFGELQNSMDLLIVAALVVKKNLLAKAGYDFPVLTRTGALSTVQLTAPKNVDSKATVRKVGHNWVITASGGVQIDPYQIVDHLQDSPTFGGARTSIPDKSPNWWWD